MFLRQQWSVSITLIAKGLFRRLRAFTFNLTIQKLSNILINSIVFYLIPVLAQFLAQFRLNLVSVSSQYRLSFVSVSSRFRLSFFSDSSQFRFSFVSF